MKIPMLNQLFMRHMSTVSEKDFTWLPYFAGTFDYPDSKKDVADVAYEREEALGLS